MKRNNDNSKGSQDKKTWMATARILSQDLDLKKSGLVTGVDSKRRTAAASSRALVPATGSSNTRQQEVLHRLREQEEGRRKRNVELMRRDEERQKKLEQRRDELHETLRRHRQQKDVEAEEKRENVARASQSRYESMVERLNKRESRRLQRGNSRGSSGRLKDSSGSSRDSTAAAAEVVVRHMERRRKAGRNHDKDQAAALLKRKRDVGVRQRATQALWNHQQRMLDAVSQRNRAELERLLAVPQPQLTARMPNYNFFEYPANHGLRRLLHEYKRKRIDETTFNNKALELTRKMSPRRILLHQNQLLRHQLATERAAERAGSAGLVHISDRPVTKRVELTWPPDATVPRRRQAQQAAAALVDEAVRRGNDLYLRLMERSDIDISTLLDAGPAQTFEDDGDLELSLSAFDFGSSELELDAAAVQRIDAMYRHQACRVHSDRQTRAYPSGMLDAFSSAVLDSAQGSCSCTTLSGVDSQCSLCQQAAAPEASDTNKGKTGGAKPAGKKNMFSGIRKLF